VAIVRAEQGMETTAELRLVRCDDRLDRFDLGQTGAGQAETLIPQPYGIGWRAR
jgi:hypothetical protein